MPVFTASPKTVTRQPFSCYPGWVLTTGTFQLFAEAKDASGNIIGKTATQTYQLWLVPATGNPISAGIFQPGQAGADSSLTATVPAGTTAKAFAVTIEPAGGKPQPTGPKVLIGAA